MLRCANAGACCGSAQHTAWPPWPRSVVSCLSDNTRGAHARTVSKPKNACPGGWSSDLDHWDQTTVHAKSGLPSKAQAVRGIGRLVAELDGSKASWTTTAAVCTINHAVDLVDRIS